LRGRNKRDFEPEDNAVIFVSYAIFLTGKTLREFADIVSKAELCAQLAFFSESLSIEEALNNVKSLDHYFFTKDFDAGIQQLNDDLGLTLVPLKENVSTLDVEISEEDINYVKEKLADEYAFLSQL
jgi:hypothetical protein